MGLGVAMPMSLCSTSLFAFSSVTLAYAAPTVFRFEFEIYFELWIYYNVS
jgi:hypothetical protein